MPEDFYVMEDVIDAKVRNIQKIFRSRRCRHIFRELVFATFVKEFDEDGRIVYRNKESGATQSTKLRCLGQEDLPDPVKYQGYALPEYSIRQVALVVHCSRFLDQQLPNIPNDRDRVKLRDALVNPYLANFGEENCFFLHNPTTQAVRTQLAAVASSPDVCLFLYFSTHALYSKSRRKTFFCFADTNTKHLERTSINLEDFCKPFTAGVSKVVVLDCCHCQRPEDTLLRFKILYPNRNFYAKIARLANAHVIGSCNLGTGPPPPSSTASDGRFSNDEHVKRKRGKWKAFSFLPHMRIDVAGSGEATVRDEIDVVKDCGHLFRDRMVTFPRAAAKSLSDSCRRSRSSADRRKLVMAKYETAGYDGVGCSYFGSAVAKALVQATATVQSDLSRPRVSVENLFVHILRDVQHRSQTRQTPQSAWGGKEPAAGTMISFAPCPPPPPGPPYAVGVPEHRRALLAWNNAPFSGAPPIQYELQSLGTAKCDSQVWSPCASFATIATNRFRVPHLVPGFGVRFRVRARNFGGWSGWSDPSDCIVPRKPFDDRDKVRYTPISAAGSGVPSTIQLMRGQSTISHVQKEGARQLAAVATRDCGFAPGSAVRNVAVEVLLDAMRRYERDAEMQAIACLVLGWCFLTTTSTTTNEGCSGDESSYNKTEAERLVEVARFNFPSNVAVVCNAGWALSQLKYARF